MKKLAILGASGHGKVVADIAEACGWEKTVFFDDSWPQVAKVQTWEVLGNKEHLLEKLPQFDAAVVAIGNNAVRLEKLRLIESMAIPLATLVHPSAIISQYSSIGRGSVIMPGVVVNAFTDIEFGAILNTGCTVDHDCSIGAGVHISPGVNIAGDVKVGKGSWIGIGASIKQGIDIGKSVIVGAGAVVITDIADGVTAVGVPAVARV